MLAEIKQTVY